ncbi:glycosyl hydrolase family 95 catalytic domain-containing protein [Streptomyces sp. NPDC050528]|uniref:glycosyl hydrolase family 95 catalytic domain-containing protein n=1 Tax=Streptomyces sp. NPDC050528 TaxID=3365623 RepID=UPI0037AAD7ED
MASILRHRRRISTLLASALVAVGLTTVQAGPAAAAPDIGDPTAPQALRTVARFQGEWDSPPTDLTNGGTVDAPLMGNGDIGVAVGGSIDDQTFYLGKNDFFSTATNGIEPLGRIVLSVPGLSGSSYHVVQNIARAQVEGTYTLGGDTLSATSWVSATENLFVTTLRLTGSRSQAATLTVQDGQGKTPTTSVGGAVLDADVQAGTASAPGNPQARIATTVPGRPTARSGNRIGLTLEPGVTYTVASAINSSHDTPRYRSVAHSTAAALTDGSLARLRAAHASWWRSYWSRSFVQIPDQAVEKGWYGSLYLLGSVSRAGKYAPGLWGNWITGAMNWYGDYHANYNYEAAFYSTLSTNHVAQMGNYDDPILDWMPRGRAKAAAAGYQGVLYPVGISPNGTSAADDLYNQKSDAVNFASDMVMKYAYTRSASYARKVLPYLRQVGLFWQDYLTWDAATDTYTIENDAPQEGGVYPQTNSILSLGLVHLLFQGLIDMSEDLHVNASLIPAWQHIDSHLAPLPTMERNGQTVFRQTSEGAGWVSDGNDVAIQAVYPGLQVGLDSPADLLRTARNTITQLDNWHSDNAPATLYAAAAMVGYNPSTLMDELHAEATVHSYPNMAVHHYGGGVENLNVMTSGLDEMLLQSHQDDLKVFPDWPADSNGKFGGLLARGNFLVSSSIRDNTVEYVRITGRSGGKLTFTNPWPGKTMEYYADGVHKGTLSGTTIKLNTSVGETIDLAPAGTSLATVRHELAQPAQELTTGSFSTGFEAGQPQPTWTDTVDTVDAKGGGNYGVTGLCCGLTGPQAAVRTDEQAHTGNASLLYSGYAGGGSYDHAYLQVYGFNGAPLTVRDGTTLSYWIFPQSDATTPWVGAGSDDSTCVAVDLIFTDGGDLRDSGATDQSGTGVHPAEQCGRLTLDAWNHVTVNLGAVGRGRAISKILVGYDRPGATGGYRGYVDDLSIG